MNFLFITYVMVVTSSQLFYRQIHDQMQFYLNFNKLRDTQQANAADSRIRSVIQQPMMTPNMDSNILPGLKSENLWQQSLLTHLPETKQTQPPVSSALKHVIPTSFTQTALTTQLRQQHNPHLPSINHRGLGKFESQMFARFYNLHFLKY